MNNTNIKKQTINSAMWVALDKVLSQGAALCVLVVLSRYLTPTDFGLIGMLIIFTALSNAFINSGFSAALIQKNNRGPEDYSTAFISNVASAIFIYVLLFSFSDKIAEFYGVPELNTLSKVYFIVLILDSLTLTLNVKLTVELNFKLLTKIRVASTVLSALVAISLAINGCGVWSIIFQGLMFSFTRLLFLVYFVEPISIIKFSKKSFYQLFSFGSKLLVTNIISVFSNNLQSVLIGRFLGVTDVGYYTQGVKASSVASGTLTEITHTVTYPVLAKMQNEHERMIIAYRKVIQMTAFITFPLMVLLALLAEPLVKIFFTDKWLPVVPIIEYLSLAAAFLPIGAINLNILNAKGRSDLFMKVDLVKLPINLIVLFYSIKFGVVGVAAGVLVSRIIAYVINCYYPGKLFSYGLYKQTYDLLPIAFCTSIMALTVYFFDIYQGVVGVAFSLLIGAAVYLTLSYVLRVDSLREVCLIFNSKFLKLTDK